MVENKIGWHTCRKCAQEYPSLQIFKWDGKIFKENRNKHYNGKWVCNGCFNELNEGIFEVRVGADGKEKSLRVRKVGQ